MLDLQTIQVPWGKSLRDMLDNNSKDTANDGVSNRSHLDEKIDTAIGTSEIRENMSAKKADNDRLLRCCIKGDAHLIPSLIKAGARVLDCDEKGMTPLLLSALYGHTLCVRELIAAGADLESMDKRHNTPLILCALCGWTACAQLLLVSGADPNACNFQGDTPLIVSSRSSASRDVVRLLVDTNRINLEHSDKKGYTALMVAIEAANLPTIKLLIDAGSCLMEQTITICNNNSKKCWKWIDVAERRGILKLVTLFHWHKVTGKSPLLIAALHGDLTSFQAILTMGYSILNETRESFGAIIIHYLRFFHEKGKTVSTVDITIFKEMLRCTKWGTLTLQEQGIAIELAVSIGSYSILKVLAEHNFSISWANFFIVAFTPDMLDFLLETFQFDDKSQIDNLLKEALQCERVGNAEILLKHGASLDIEAALRDAVKRTHMKALEFIVNEYKQEAYTIIQNSDFLHIAVKNSLVDVIPLLLDCGAEVNKEFDYHCLLTLAEDHRVVDLLLSRGADVNMTIDSESSTYPLLWFVSEDFKTYLLTCQEEVDSDSEESFVNNETLEIVKSLLRHGGLVDVKNYQGETALHLASERSNSADIINLLVEAGINVNETDNVMRTGLHVAVINQRIENIPCLLDAGIDLNSIDEMNKTAVFDATDPRVLELLVQRGADVNVVRLFMRDTVLLHALLSEFDTPEYVQILIRAGVNLNQKDIYDNWALMVAARRMDVDLFKLLVTSGADMNMTTQDSKNVTVITKLIYSLYLHFQKAKECISFCLDHGADISMLPPIVIHALISSGCLSLVSKFISFGFAPVHLTMHNKSNVWNTTEITRSISPLATALLLNHAELAQYFIDIKYLLGSDISILSGNAHFQEHTESMSNADSVEFLERVRLQPLSLETLSFIVISDALGSGQDRNSKVKKLRLPQMIQDMLMFRNVAEDLVKDSSTKNEFLFLHSLKRYKSDDYDNDGNLLDSDDEEILEEVM